MDENHRIRADGDDREGAMIRRNPHAVHQQLALVERTETGRRWIAKVDGAKEFAINGIGDGDGVRVLLSGVDAVLMADGNIGVGRGAGSLPGKGIADAGDACRDQQNRQDYVALHVTAPSSELHYQIANRSSPQAESDQAMPPTAAKPAQATPALP